MELPPYRMPTIKTLGLHLWIRIKDFLSKAGTVLLGASIIIWFLQYFNFNFSHVENTSESMLGLIGTFIAPIFKPLGFGNWESSVAMLSGLIARESVVSTLEIVTGNINALFTPLSAFCFMVFALLFVPCIAAIATIKKEMNSAKWTVFALSFEALVAWIVTFVIYQFGSLIVDGIGDLVSILIGVTAVLLTMFMIYNKVKSRNCCGTCASCNGKDKEKCKVDLQK